MDTQGLGKQIKTLHYAAVVVEIRCFQNQTALGQTKNYKKWYPQLPSLTFSNKKGQCKVSTEGGRQVHRLQAQLYLKRPLAVSSPNQLGAHEGVITITKSVRMQT